MEFKGRRGAAKGGQGDRGMADGLELGGVSRGGRGTQGCPWRGRIHCSLLEGAELKAVGVVTGREKGGYLGGTTTELGDTGYRGECGG